MRALLRARKPKPDSVKVRVRKSPEPVTKFSSIPARISNADVPTCDTLDSHAASDGDTRHDRVFDER